MGGKGYFGDRRLAFSYFWRLEITIFIVGDLEMEGLLEIGDWHFLLLEIGDCKSLILEIRKNMHNFFNIQNLIMIPLISPVKQMAVSNDLCYFWRWKNEQNYFWRLEICKIICGDQEMRPPPSPPQ